MDKCRIGHGCCINPRICIVSKTKIRDTMVVSGPNMKYYQPLTRKRNISYITALAKTSRETFEKLEAIKKKKFTLMEVK